MSDSSSDGDEEITIVVTPMHRTAEGIWESGPREGAQFFLVEAVRGDGEDAEVVVECRDARTAALAARVAAATVAALGLGGSMEELSVEPFDAETAALLAENPTPEVETPAGEWRELEEEDPDEPRS